jgi:hypothetical protein
MSYLYVGMWADGYWNGYGRLIEVSGDVYEGFFQMNAFHGYGTKYCRDGQVLTGYFEQTVFKGQYYHPPKLPIVDEEFTLVPIKTNKFISFRQQAKERARGKSINRYEPRRPTA